LPGPGRSTGRLAAADLRQGLLEHVGQGDAQFEGVLRFMADSISSNWASRDGFEVIDSISAKCKAVKMATIFKEG